MTAASASRSMPGRCWDQDVAIAGTFFFAPVRSSAWRAAADKHLEQRIGRSALFSTCASRRRAPLRGRPAGERKAATSLPAGSLAWPDRFFTSCRTADWDAVGACRLPWARSSRRAGQPRLRPRSDLRRAWAASWTAQLLSRAREVLRALPAQQSAKGLQPETSHGCVQGVCVRRSWAQASLGSSRRVRCLAQASPA